MNLSIEFIEDKAVFSTSHLYFSQMLSLLPTRTLRLLEFVGFSGNKVSIV